jgi:hypothetical protein
MQRIGAARAMKIFLSYAKEQRDLAQRIALALEGAGFDVFFDHEKLPPAGEFNIAIRNAIHDSDLFLFLASREAIQGGAYALTELGIAQRHWPHPAQRVMTLLADATPVTALPAYLSAVTVLRPSGDPVAETVDAVARWRDAWRRRWIARGAAAAVAVVVAAVAALWFAPRNVSAPIGDTRLTEADVDGGVPNNRVYRLKNGHAVRVTGSVVSNESNVAERIVRGSIESNAFQYNQCYDRQFGQLATGLPEGKVEIAFDIIDQLPRHAKVTRSDFALPAFAECVQSMLSGKTLNAAGPNGTGKVLYRLSFLPN